MVALQWAHAWGMEDLLATHVLFTQNTLTQRPRYYVTVDLRPELGQSVGVDEDGAIAKYEGPSLHVILPLVGTAGASLGSTFTSLILFSKTPLLPSASSPRYTGKAPSGLSSSNRFSLQKRLRSEPSTGSGPSPCASSRPESLSPFLSPVATAAPAKGKKAKKLPKKAKGKGGEGAAKKTKTQEVNRTTEEEGKRMDAMLSQGPDFILLFFPFF